jgi:hypothetical protein
MQGNKLAGFVKMYCESSFIYRTTGECRHQQLQAFLGILSVPPEVSRGAVSISAVERGHRSFPNTKRFRVLLHWFLLAAHPCAERQ